jgi:hypothetical protein
MPGSALPLLRDHHLKEAGVWRTGPSSPLRGRRLHQRRTGAKTRPIARAPIRRSTHAGRPSLAPELAEPPDRARAASAGFDPGDDLPPVPKRATAWRPPAIGRHRRGSAAAGPEQEAPGQIPRPATNPKMTSLCLCQTEGLPTTFSSRLLTLMRTSGSAGLLPIQGVRQSEGRTARAET